MDCVFLQYLACYLITFLNSEWKWLSGKIGRGLSQGHDLHKLRDHDTRNSGRLFDGHCWWQRNKYKHYQIDVKESAWMAFTEAKTIPAIIWKWCAPNDINQNIWELFYRWYFWLQFCQYYTRGQYLFAHQGATQLWKSRHKKYRQTVVTSVTKWSWRTYNRVL